MTIDFFALLLCRLRATIELWCNGNTADFGSVILSSNLGSSTKEGGRRFVTSFFFAFVVRGKIITFVQNTFQ